MIYAYTTARVKAMKSLLLRSDDFMKLRNMGISEITRFLQEGHYKQDIEALLGRFSGMQLVNVALNYNLARSVNKLSAVATKETVHEAVARYAQKWVAANVKIVLRTRLNRLSKDNIASGIVPVKLSEEACLRLLENDDAALAQAVGKLCGINARAFLTLLEARDLAGMENMIDRSYYRQLLEFAPELPRLTRELFMLVAEINDIRNVAKMVHQGVDANTIARQLVSGSTLAASLAKEMSTDALLHRLVDSRYRIQEQRVGDFENALDRFLLSYAERMLHVHPLSLHVVFCYLLLKEIEIRNVRILVNAKAMKAEHLIEKNVIIAA